MWTGQSKYDLMSHSVAGMASRSSSKMTRKIFKKQRLNVHLAVAAEVARLVPWLGGAEPAV